MIVFVCGSRDWRDAALIEERLRVLPRGTTIVHGGARGADRLAGTIATKLGFAVREYPADWKRYGRSAGVRRSIAMLDEEKPDVVLAFWLNGSTGTAHTIRAARARGVPVSVEIAA